MLRYNGYNGIGFLVYFLVALGVVFAREPWLILVGERTQHWMSLALAVLLCSTKGSMGIGGLWEDGNTSFSELDRALWF